MSGGRGGGGGGGGGRFWGILGRRLRVGGVRVWGMGRGRGVGAGEEICVPKLIMSVCIICLCLACMVVYIVLGCAATLQCVQYIM